MIIQNVPSKQSNSKIEPTEDQRLYECMKSEFSNSDKKKLPLWQVPIQTPLFQPKFIQKKFNKLFQSLENTGVTHQAAQSKMLKSSSQPKIRTYKEQILRIPKVKQILQKDKFIYQQDIQKRLQLIGNIKSQNYQFSEINKLKQMNQPLSEQAKRNKRHKTNYKIPLNRKNVQSLNKLIEHHISHNQHFKNQAFVYLSQNDYQEPFDLKKLNFMDEINPLKKLYKQKFPQFKQGVLAKNKLLLEHVILTRNVKREMKLDKKNNKKDHETHDTSLNKTKKIKVKI